MSVDWSNLLFLVIGWALSRLGDYLSSKQSLANALTVARDARRYEVGRDAYKSAMTAIHVGLDVVQQRRTASPPEMLELLRQFYDPLRDARIALGLPVTEEIVGELIDALFIVPTAAEKGGDIDAARDRALATIHKHREEITAAWREVLHGR